MNLWDVPGRGVRAVLLALAFALVVIALAKPTLPLSSGVFRHLVVFDITQSMNVGDATPSDAAPTRLEHAKAAVIEAAAALPCGSEIGLGLFAGHRTFLVLAPVEVCANYADILEIVRHGGLADGLGRAQRSRQGRALRARGRQGRLVRPPRSSS